jgi:hypothetical protein
MRSTRRYDGRDRYGLVENSNNTWIHVGSRPMYYCMDLGISGCFTASALLRSEKAKDVFPKGNLRPQVAVWG